MNAFPDNPLTPDEEARLVASNNLEELVNRTMRPAVNIGHQIARGRLSEGDLISVVYLALRDSARNFDPARPTRFLAFAKPSIRYGIFRELKSRRSIVPDTVIYQETVQDFDEKPIPKEVEYANPDTDGIELRSKYEAIQPALKKLSQQEQKILQLSYVDNLNGQQLANIFGVSRSAIQRRILVALRKVRKELARTKKLNE